MFKNCTDCPMGKVFCDEAVPMQYALDLIIRQQTEIEEQDQAIINVLHRMKQIRIEAKAEAIKKFAERLKEYRYTSSDWSHGEHPMVVEWDDVENVIWELTEGNDDKV